MGNTNSGEKEETADEITDVDTGDHYGPEFLPIHLPSVGTSFMGILISLVLVAVIFVAVRRCIHRYGGRRGGGRWNGDPEFGYHGYHAYPFAGIELQQRHHYAPQLDYYAARPLPALPAPRPLPALYAPLPNADDVGRIYEPLSGDARTAAPAVGRQENINNQEPAYVKAGKQKKLALHEPPALK